MIGYAVFAYKVSRMKLPKTQQLVIFQAVAINRSINAAARALKLPQSTLSRALKELEETLNCQLLERGGAGVTLRRQEIHF